MIKIKTRWRKDNCGCYYLTGWSVRRRIAERELVALEKPDGEIVYGRVTRAGSSWKCRDCMLCMSSPDGAVEICPFIKNGYRFCYLCGSIPTGKYKFIKVDLDQVLENL